MQQKVLSQQNTICLEQQIYTSPGNYTDITESTESTESITESIESITKSLVRLLIVVT